MLSHKLRVLAAAVIASVTFQVAIAADTPATPTSPSATSAPASTLNETDKISYSIGVDLGQSFRKQSIDINPDTFVKGLKDGQQDTQSLLSKEEIYQTLLSLQSKLAQQQAQAFAAQAKANLTKGEQFLANNKTQPGIKTTQSGLQYRVMKAGNGKTPKATDIVTTHYRGHLIDGTEFDSSYKRNEPATFAVNAVIPGWTEALQLMTPGAKWEIFIPAKLAYGEQGIGKAIGPNETLVFEVELISVKSKDAANDKQSKAPNKSANTAKKDPAKTTAKSGKPAEAKPGKTAEAKPLADAAAKQAKLTTEAPAAATKAIQ